MREIYRLSAATDMYERVANFMIRQGLHFTARTKTESSLMKAISVVLFFVPFMTDFTTTIGSTVYYPEDYVDEFPDDAAQTLGHEGFHIKQRKRDGFVYNLKYLFPQVLAPLALLAFLAFWWLPALWFLLFLVCLAPLPAPFRVKYEREAYLVTMVLDARKGWDIRGDWYQKYMVEHYCGFNYYKPAWNRSRIRRLVAEDTELALKILGNKVYNNYITPLLEALD